MLTLGGALKRKEKLSARLGDMLSYMYIASAVLKRYEDQGRQSEDLPLVEWACRQALYHLQEQMHGFLRNFPNRFGGGRAALPDLPARPHVFGAQRRTVAIEIAELLSTPSAARARLTRNTYTGDKHSPVGMFAEALELAIQLEPMEKKIHTAIRATRTQAGTAGITSGGSPQGWYHQRSRSSATTATGTTYPRNLRGG